MGIGNLGSESVQNAESNVPWSIIEEWALPEKIKNEKSERIH